MWYFHTWPRGYIQFPCPGVELMVKQWKNSYIFSSRQLFWLTRTLITLDSFEHYQYNLCGRGVWYLCTLSPSNVQFWCSGVEFIAKRWKNEQYKSRYCCSGTVARKSHAYNSGLVWALSTKLMVQVSVIFVHMITKLYPTPVLWCGVFSEIPKKVPKILFFGTDFQENIKKIF